jgi:hypothetical protein
VVVAGTLILRAAGAPERPDGTRADDYEVEAGDPGVEALPAAVP